MTHTFIVTVETDDTNVDAPDGTAIRNEILSNLESLEGDDRLVYVNVRRTSLDYRDAVERSCEQ